MTPLEQAIDDGTVACRGAGCHELIAWAIGEAGGRIPFEPEPADDGDLELRYDGVELHAHVIRERKVHEAQLGLELDVDVHAELGPRYRSHWSRCPDAPTWRREL